MLICVLRFPVNLSGDYKISNVRVRNFILRACRGVEGVVGEVKSFSWGGATSPLVRAPPQMTLFTSPTTPSTPWHVRGIQFRTLEI